MEIFYDADLVIVGQTQVVEIYAKSFSDYEPNTNNRLSKSDNFTVTYLNPCIDTGYTTITNVN